MIFLKAFIVGGIICALVQIVIDKTKVTPARIMVSLVCIGVVLGAIGIYEPLTKWASVCRGRHDHSDRSHNGKSVFRSESCAFVALRHFRVKETFHGGYPYIAASGSQ